MSVLKIVLLVMLPIFVGCSSAVGDKESIIPQSERTLEDVYGQASGNGSAERAATILRRPVSDYEMGHDPYLQNGVERVRYRKLPNPTIYLYFFPSVTEGERLPTPGWMTEFGMYERDEYAKPGEAYVGEVR
ncbi:hypothetical protein ACP3V3_02070 [Vibrio sp. PNB22_3_1]